MKPLSLLPYYISWHYSVALKNIVAVTKNLAWFFWHFFSIGLLLSTLFTPWQKIQDDHVAQALDFEAMASTMLINVLMRIAGAIIRLFMVCIGLVTIIGTVVGGCIFFMFWLLLPLCIVVSFAIGVIIIFKPS